MKLDNNNIKRASQLHARPFCRKGKSDFKSKKMKISLFLGLAFISMKPSLAFTQVAVLGKRRRSQSSSLYFRGLGELPYLDQEHMDTYQDSMPMSHHLPLWLQQESCDDAEALLVQLEEMMLGRYLIKREVTDIVSAIKDAAKGDWRKISGAVKLCMILVDIMDMGVNTIIAAAYHYCACFEIRENASLHKFSSQSSATFFPTQWDSESQYENQSQYLNPEAARIARATAALKKTEVIALSLVQAADFENLRVLLLSETKDWRALAIRSAAALYRLRGVINAFEASSNIVLGVEEMRVAREALHIYAPLASRLGMHRLKNELEAAAFRILYKRQYDTVTSLSQQARGYFHTETISDGMKRVINEFTNRVIYELERDPALNRYTNNIRVSARIKQPYSLWKKMLKIGARNVLDVPDALAMRIVIDAKKNFPDEDDEITAATEKALCYYVQELCIKKWKPNERNARFKDYIDRPKKNGYQSLHYSAKTNFLGDDWNLEIQIRSGRMHQVAEYGLASHWDYKLENETNNQDTKSNYQLDHCSEAYLKSVQAWHWQQSGYDQTELTEFEISGHSEAWHESDEQNRIRVERERENAERLAPYIEAFSSAQSSVTRNQVLVFLSPTDDSTNFDPKIISLPSGSCVMDALREGEKLFGIITNFHGIGVVQNDKETILTERLTNGDVLKIPAMNVESMLTM